LSFAPNMRVIVFELSNETKEPVDAVFVAMDLDRPGSCLLKAFVVLVEDFLLDLARNRSKKTTARAIEIAMKLGLEAAARSVE
jgi:hypothetical protein